MDHINLSLSLSHRGGFNSSDHKYNHEDFNGNKIHNSKSKTEDELFSAQKSYADAA